MKILLVGAESLRAGGWTDGRTVRWTDMTNLIVALAILLDVPKK